MLLIKCPYCGERPEAEFHCGGEAHIARPDEPGQLDNKQWAEFLFYRDNTKGVIAERWIHNHGCQRWFNALRHTVSDKILVTYLMGQPRPAIDMPDEASTSKEPATPDLSATPGETAR